MLFKLFDNNKLNSKLKPIYILNVKNDYSFIYTYAAKTHFILTIQPGAYLI